MMESMKSNEYIDEISTEFEINEEKFIKPRIFTASNKITYRFDYSRKLCAYNLIDLDSNNIIATIVETKTHYNMLSLMLPNKLKVEFLMVEIKNYSNIFSFVHHTIEKIINLTDCTK